MSLNNPTLLHRLICVPQCASCQKRLSPIVDETKFNHGIPCMCDECMSSWQAACARMCHTCSKVASECTCIPNKKVFAQPYIPSLFFYRPDTSLTESKVVYTIKHKDNRDLFNFLSIELAKKLGGLLRELDISADECIFTHISRTQRAIIKNGFDQGERLSRALSHQMGAVCLPLLSREGGKEQKKLSHHARKKNAQKTIYLNKSMRGFGRKYRKTEFEDIIRGKIVIIVEDIITTGATVERAIKCLKEGGAKSVLVCAVARSEIHAENNK